MDLFSGDDCYTAILARIEALEAAVFPKAAKPSKETKAEPLMAGWSQWEAYRHGKGWTANARALNMRKLRELAGEDGELAIKIVQQSIEFGWKGLFPLKHHQGHATTPVKHKTVAEAMTPTESKLQRHLGWLKQQLNLGAITEEQHAQQAKAAQERLG